MDEGDELGRTQHQLSPPRRRVSTGGRDALIGQKLGEYTVLERIGGGAMGTIYRGEQQLLGRTVAIKLVSAAYANDQTFIDRFLAEARAAASVRHPNIIDVFSLGLTPGGHPYLVMELLEGDTLEEYLRYEGGKLEPRDAVELLSQTTAALAAAHRAGVIHRDLKPSNIFVVRLEDESRFIKLLDFGIAKRTAPGQGARATAAMVGTPIYMAPEAADGGVVGPYTDLYSLGCLAYELVTGKVPFERPSLMAVIDAHHTYVPPAPEGPGVPPGLSALILELLEKDPAQRPASIAVMKKLQQLALELDNDQRTSPALHNRATRSTRLRPAPTDISAPAFAEPAVIHARPTSIDAAPTRLKTPALKRSRAAIGLGLLGAVAVVGAVAFALWPQSTPLAPVPAATPIRPAVAATPPPEPEVVKPSPPPPSPQEPAPKTRATAPAKATHAAQPVKEETIFAREKRVQALKQRASQLDTAKMRAAAIQLDELLGDLGRADIDQTIDGWEKKIAAAEAEARP
ncbi:MAG: serine/threonine-protein kinase [Myxococcaceae bacterium]